MMVVFIYLLIQDPYCDVGLADLLLRRGASGHKVESLSEQSCGLAWGADVTVSVTADCVTASVAVNKYSTVLIY